MKTVRLTFVASKSELIRAIRYRADTQLYQHLDRGLKRVHYMNIPQSAQQSRVCSNGPGDRFIGGADSRKTITTLGAADRLTAAVMSPTKLYAPSPRIVSMCIKSADYEPQLSFVTPASTPTSEHAMHVAHPAGRGSDTQRRYPGVPKILRIRTQASPRAHRRSYTGARSKAGICSFIAAFTSHHCPISFSCNDFFFFFTAMVTPL